jgi:CheY-like chemotaxis protein
MLKKQLEIEQKQALFLANMSENIFEMAQKAFEQNGSVIESSEISDEFKKELHGKKENLLDTTHDLIDFLQLKSKKVEINHEVFNLNNVLNEISGTIGTQFSGSRVELIFDTDTNIPRWLIGDSLHLGQVLQNILEHRMGELEEEELRLKISMFKNFENKVELQFQFIDDGKGLSEEARENLFVPYYVEQEKAYVGLGLFVAKELVEMMGGELSVHSQLGKGTTFTLSILFEQIDEQDKRRYRLPKKALTDKKVCIIDNSYTAALAIKKMFAYFKHDVKVISRERFLETKPVLSEYDIVVINESLLSFQMIEYFKRIKQSKEFKVVALNSLLRLAQTESITDTVIDEIMLKPLNQERVFELITRLYTFPEEVREELENQINRPKAKVIKSDIVESKNITPKSFTAFKGKHILIVEDNLINQKVLTNLFQVSEMKISIANNGKEAVELVKNTDEVFDLVLMDINMPVMDGYTATQTIRYEKRFDTLPIVAFTALLLETEIEKMFKSGVNAFLSKPLNVGKLYTVMSSFLLEVPEVKKEKSTLPLEEERISYKGLNVAWGIEHANNNEALYIEILKEFSEAYGQSAEVFATLVNEHRYEQLKMLCLDMKGLTGSIGAEEMHAEVSEIYKMIIYKKHQVLSNYIESYKKSLEELMQSIEAYTWISDLEEV